MIEFAVNCCALFSVCSSNSLLLWMDDDRFSVGYIVSIENFG